MGSRTRYGEWGNDYLGDSGLHGFQAEPSWLSESPGPPAHPLHLQRPMTLWNEALYTESIWALPADEARFGSNSAI